MRSKRWVTYLIMVAIIINLVFFGCGYSFILQAKNVLYQEKVNYMKEISLKTAQNIQGYIEGYVTTVDAIAAFVSTHDPYEIEHVISILQTECEKNNFKRMGIILPDGTAITTDNMTFDFNDREYFRQAMNGKSVVSDKLLVDKADGKEINVIAAPVYYNNEVVEVIFATKTQENFSDIMQIESFGGEGYSYIITSDGSPVVKTTHPNSVGDYSNLFDEIRARDIMGENLDRMQNDILNGKDGTFENDRKSIKSQIYYT